MPTFVNITSLHGTPSQQFRHGFQSKWAQHFRHGFQSTCLFTHIRRARLLVWLPTSRVKLLACIDYILESHMHPYILSLFGCIRRNSQNGSSWWTRLTWDRLRAASHPIIRNANALDKKTKIRHTSSLPHDWYYLQISHETCSWEMSFARARYSSFKYLQLVQLGHRAFSMKKIDYNCFPSV